MKKFMNMKKLSSLFLILLIAIYILEGSLHMVQATEMDEVDEELQATGMDEVDEELQATGTDEENEVVEDDIESPTATCSGTSLVDLLNDFTVFSFEDMKATYSNFDECYNMIIAGSNRLLINGSLDGTYIVTRDYDSREDDDGILSVNIGECWNITDASNLQEIQITLPDGSTSYNLRNSLQLTVNFSCESINPVEVIIDGETETVSQFPVITFDNDTEGYGNKIIWNMPDIEGKIITLPEAYNQVGHMIMPNAEFWGYSIGADNTLTQNSGNINGSVIAQEVHLGETKIHMWSYDGVVNEIEVYMASEIEEAAEAEGVVTDEIVDEAELSGVTCSVNALKLVDYKPPDKSYVFELAYKNSDADGYKGEEIMQVESDATTGDIVFQDLCFTKAGIYEFYLYEVIPSEEEQGSVIYDETKYLVTVEVTDTEGELATAITITKIENSVGEAVTIDEENVPLDAIFNNSIKTPGQFELPDTGGNGATGYVTFGLTLIVVSLVLYRKQNIEVKYIKHNI